MLALKLISVLIQFGGTIRFRDIEIYLAQGSHDESINVSYNVPDMCMRRPWALFY